MFEAYQQIRIINLPERTDRRREMIKELGRIGLKTDPRVSFFSAVRPKDRGPFRSVGVHGVYLSHLSILKEAVEANQSVLILEDDCDFTAAVSQQRPRSDLLWGGYEIYQRHIEGAHCMGFAAATAKRVADYLEHLLMHDPIDVDGAYIWFCRDNPDVRVDACNPIIAVQRPSFSDIAGPGKTRHLPPIVLRIVRLAKRTIGRRRTSADSFEALVTRLRTGEFDTSVASLKSGA